MSALRCWKQAHACVATVALLLGSITGCDTTHQPVTPLRLAAASDLQLALPKLADRFQSKTGVSCSITFGASGQLAEQIKQGAPFDVFLSANESFVRALASEGIVKADSVRPYARGSLVIAVHKSHPGTLGSLNDLTDPTIKKIALANPATAPYGKAAKQALERAGLWAKLESRIVFAESVRQALLYAQKGDAEAAFAGRAIASVPEVRVVDVDPSLYDPIIQGLGVIGASNRAADADRFARFVLSSDGQGVLSEFGFKPPAAAEPPKGRSPSLEPNPPRGSKP